MAIFRLILTHVQEAESERTLARKMGDELTTRLRGFATSLGGSANPYRLYKSGERRYRQLEQLNMADFDRRVRRHFDNNQIKRVVDKATNSNPLQYAKDRLKSMPLEVFKSIVGDTAYNTLQGGINVYSNKQRANMFDYIMDRVENNAPFREGVDFGSTAIAEMMFRPSLSSRVTGIRNANAVGTCEIRFKEQRKQGYYTYYNVPLQLFIDMLQRKGKGGHVGTPAGAWSYFMTESHYFMDKQDFGRDKTVKAYFGRQMRGATFNKKQKATLQKVLPIKRIWLTQNNNKAKQSKKGR